MMRYPYVIVKTEAALAQTIKQAYAAGYRYGEYPIEVALHRATDYLLDRIGMTESEINVYLARSGPRRSLSWLGGRINLSPGGDLFPVNNIAHAITHLERSRPTT